MKVVILAGGYGSRLNEETSLIPKPLVEIGGKPILWHIMKHYSSYGYNDFVILLGYKGNKIKEYFINYLAISNNIQVDLLANKTKILSKNSEDWKVSLIDTGLETLTGGRIKKAKDFIGKEKFMLTYGDGVSDINLNDLLQFHNEKKATVTMSSVRPHGRFGTFTGNNSFQVTDFLEKPRGEGASINGGFFVCEPEIFNYIKDDNTILEREPMETMARDGVLFHYEHSGFWKCMDTLKDKDELNTMLNSNNAPWVSW